MNIHEPSGDTDADRDESVELCEGTALVEPDIEIDVQMLRKEGEDREGRSSGEMPDVST